VTPERAQELVARWVRFYTRELPAPIVQRRVEEIGTDAYDQIAYERGRGTSDRRIALGILSRMARGMAADASWRRQVRPLNGVPMKIVIAVLVAALGVAFAVYAGRDDAPGGVLMGLLLVVGAVVFVVRAIRARRRST
jgi:peptidoglycan/LPS O-acetylase OafA/YrhL